MVTFWQKLALLMLIPALGLATVGCEVEVDDGPLDNVEDAAEELGD